MKNKRRRKPAVNYKTLTNNVDPEVLALFPDLNLNGTNERKKDAAQKRLTILYLIAQNHSTALQLSEKTGLTKNAILLILRKLSKLGLIEASKVGRYAHFSVSTMGAVALTSFHEYQSFAKMQTLLAVPAKKNDKLAYALLVIGNCANDKDDSVYTTLKTFANQGCCIERLDSEGTAMAIMRFFSQQAKTNRSYPANYLGVFKEFTTAGFQEILRLLLTALKPTVDDYNWLIEFFNATSEFYFSPERLAYVNLLAKDVNLKQRLEAYKKSQDSQVKKTGSQMEVTFNVPNSGLEKYPTMPPYLKAIVMRLILEPNQFVNLELNRYFFDSKQPLE
ncbi:MAG: winged helix-turn-helix domain-containing protein [Candidatus Bathyarchaeota archaeon]|nr:winged helix-turn-helix domain-containing protein [Candidatus Bathyarchaeota archaeon]